MMRQVQFPGTQGSSPSVNSNAAFPALNYISLKALLVSTLSHTNLAATSSDYGALRVSRPALEENQLKPGGRFGAGTTSLKLPQAQCQTAKLRL